MVSLPLDFESSAFIIKRVKRVLKCYFSWYNLNRKVGFEVIIIPKVYRKSNRTIGRKITPTIKSRMNIHALKITNNMALGVCKNYKCVGKRNDNDVSYSNVRSANIDLDSIVDDITIKHAKTLERLAK
jgi:hypothetical protein